MKLKSIRDDHIRGVSMINEIQNSHNYQKSLNYPELDPSYIMSRNDYPKVGDTRINDGEKLKGFDSIKKTLEK